MTYPLILSGQTISFLLNGILLILIEYIINDICKNNCGVTKENGDKRCQIYTLNNTNELCGEATRNMMSSGANLNISK